MRLFFYGTLMAGTGPRGDQLAAVLARAVPAWTPGRLYALPDPSGWYPALVTDPHGPHVHGVLHAATPAFTANHLAALDAYEGADHPDAGAREYLRCPLRVRRISDGRWLAAQAYIYKRPLPAGAEPIADGDFAAWLRRTGRSSFAG